MILKDGESLVHLKTRMNKEISELSPEDAKSYVQEAIKDIWSAVRKYEIPVNEGRALIESIDPEFYTRPIKENELRIKGYLSIMSNCIQIVAFVAFLVWIWNL